MKRWNAVVISGLVFATMLSFQTAEAETLTYTDKLGRTVAVPLPVNRAAIFQIYELIPALGIADKIVGIGSYAYDNDLMKAAIPDIKNTIPCAGNGVDLNIEALLKMEPDVVITWTFRPDSLRFMEQKGLRVIGISPENLSELYDVIRLHGSLFGKQDRAEMCIAEMEKIFSAVTATLSVLPPGKRRKVLYLMGRPTSVAGDAGVAGDLVKMSGGINSASGIRQQSSDVSMEQIVAWDPDVIFIWGHAGYTAQSILESAQWRCIRAVREGRVYKAPKWSNWSLRIAPVVLWMAAKTYPDAFQHIDLDVTFDEFYRKVYGIPYEKVTTVEK